MRTTVFALAAAALFAAFTFDRLLPAALMAVLFGMFIFVLVKAQRRGDFDASEFLRDDRNKLSWGRLAAFICCMCSSARCWRSATSTSGTPIQARGWRPWWVVASAP